MLIFNRSAAKTTVFVRRLHEKSRQQHQVSTFNHIVTIYTPLFFITNADILFIDTTKFYSCRVLSIGIHANGTHWKEAKLWRKTINDDLNTLSEKKQLLDLPNGGAKVIASPTLQPIIIPFRLRQIPVNQWRHEDRIWLNV